MSDKQDAELNLGTRVRSVLGQFEGRTIDDALLLAMATILNKELASLLDEQRIELLQDGAALRAEVVPSTNTTASLKDVSYDAVATALLVA